MATDDNAKKLPRSKGKPFLPGEDPRRNSKGRPLGSTDPLKEIGKRISEKRVRLGFSLKELRKLQELGYLQEITEDMEVAEAIMLRLALSDNPAKLEMFLERTFGKVPNKNINENSGFDWTRYISKYTDAELERIKSGDDPLAILVSKIPDAESE